MRRVAYWGTGTKTSCPSTLGFSCRGDSLIAFSTANRVWIMARPQSETSQQHRSKPNMKVKPESWTAIAVSTIQVSYHRDQLKCSH